MPLHDGRPRHFCPHILGEKTGILRVLAWPFDGASEAGDLPGWRCLTVSRLSGLRLLAGPWHRGEISTGEPQTCIDRIDAAVTAVLQPVPRHVQPPSRPFRRG